LHRSYCRRRIVIGSRETPLVYGIDLQIRFTTRTRALLEVTEHPDTHILKLFGHPMDDVTLMVTHLDSSNTSGNFSSDEKPLNPRNETTFLANALYVRPLDPRHWKFPIRWYEVFSRSCAFCDFDHPTGQFSFKVCERRGNSTPDDAADCEELVHDINHWPNATAPSPPSS
ncbi:hypothetical protein PENTCL1PPCAC_27849, partial [Pristionchus entomophagus]